MKILAIIGSGELGQQIAHYALSDDLCEKVVFFDDFSIGRTDYGEVIGKLSEIEGKYKSQYFDEIILGIGYKHMDFRKAFFDDLKKKNIPFAKIIHSSCIIDSLAEIHEGTIIYPGCIIDKKVVIKSNTLVNLGCTISHDVVIEDSCFLAPRVAIGGFTIIESDCFLGVNSTILNNLNVVSSTIIGGGTVVIDNIEEAGTYVGNPHRKIN